MTRPKEIYWFAWIQIALLAFGLFSILTNWDVLRLASLVKTGFVVDVHA